MSKAENVIVVFFFFGLFMSLYGLSVPGSSASDTLNQLTAGPPSFPGVPAIGGCGGGDVTCATQHIANAAIQVATDIFYPIVIIDWFFGEMLLFFSFTFTAISGPQSAAQSAPLVGVFFATLIVYVLFEGFRMFRGNSTAGV